MGFVDSQGLLKVLGERGEHAAADVVERVLQVRHPPPRYVEPRRLVDALRERGADAAADVVGRVLLEARAATNTAAADAAGVMAALERDRARGNVSTWYSA